MTGERSTITIPSIIAIKSTFSRKYKVPTLSSASLFRRDKLTCAYCGRICRENTHHSPTVDHIIPVSRGGEHSWMNCVLACKKCNNHKDNMLLTEANMELLYLPYVPSPVESLILRNRHILADQMSFLVPFLPEHSRAKDLYVA